MRFLDPHGVERVDREVFECTQKDHIFRLVGAELRLIASGGQRLSRPRKFVLENGCLVELGTHVAR
jgi:hypothetical protein